MSYSSNVIHKAIKLLFEQHPPTDFLYLYIMFKQENNLASENNKIANSSYCFDADALNEFFTDRIIIEEFSNSMRTLIYNTSMQYLKDCHDGEGYMPHEVYCALDSLNSFTDFISSINQKNK